MVNITTLNRFFAESWVKALFIAFPISLTFGLVASFGFIAGAGEIIQVFFTSDDLKNEIHHIEWWIFISGLCGVLGIAGIWLRLIFQDKLAKTVSCFNWFTFILLSTGVFGVFWLLLGPGFGYGPFGEGRPGLFSFFQEEKLIVFVCLCLAAYGGWLAYTTIKPNNHPLC